MVAFSGFVSPLSKGIEDDTVVDVVLTESVSVDATADGLVEEVVVLVAGVEVTEEVADSVAGIEATEDVIASAGSDAVVLVSSLVEDELDEAVGPGLDSTFASL